MHTPGEAEGVAVGVVGDDLSGAEGGGWDEDAGGSVV